MVGATALGSVMGLTFTGAYLAGGIANAAVLNAPSPEADGAHAADSFSTETTSRVGVGSPIFSNPHSGVSIFSPEDRASLTAVSSSFAAPSVIGGDAADKLSAFQQTYSVIGGRVVEAGSTEGRPVFEDSVSEYAMRKSSRELDCLTAALYYEARGEGQSGMEAVAQVIVNRARHPDFPKTLCGVIYQGAGRGRGCQFSFACDGSMRRRSEGALWDRARAVAERAMDGPVSRTVGSSTFFHATRIAPNWRGLSRVATVGRHVFYRHAGARGSSARFLRGPVGGDAIGDFAGIQLASAVTKAPAEARLYRTADAAPKVSRAMRSVRATFTAEPEQSAPYRIARINEDVVIAPDFQPLETLSLDAIVDAAVSAS